MRICVGTVYQLLSYLVETRYAGDNASIQRLRTMQDKAWLAEY